MGQLTKRARTGFVGEFYVYSELLRNDFNCFITLGNAKSVDLIVIDKNRKAHFIDVKSSNSTMNNQHNHPNNASSNRLSRWQIGVRHFWDTYIGNPKRLPQEFADFYVFHSLTNRGKEIVVTGKELELLMHQKIDDFLQGRNLKEIPEKDLGVWVLCDLCFERVKDGGWGKIPK